MPQLLASCLRDSNSRPGRQHQRSPGASARQPAPACGFQHCQSQHTCKASLLKNEPPCHTLTHILTHTLTHTHTHTHTHILIYTHSNIFTHTHTHRYTHSNIYTHLHSHTHTHMHMHSHIYTHSHSNIPTHVHAHSPAHSHTHTHTCSHTLSYTHTQTHPMMSTHEPSVSFLMNFVVLLFYLITIFSFNFPLSPVVCLPHQAEPLSAPHRPLAVQWRKEGWSPDLKVAAAECLIPNPR